MKAWESKDVKMLVEMELARNTKVRELVNWYEEMNDAEKALFRLATGYDQDIGITAYGR